MTPAPVLLITRDDGLLDDLLRLAAAAGVSLDVEHETAGALRGWATAAVVLVGADLVERVAEQRPPRRDRVHVVGPTPIRDDVFRSALVAGAQDVVELPAAEDWVVELLTDAGDEPDGSAGRPGRASRRARTVGVIGGSGGAGATTFACALALVSALRETTLLVDLDPLGPGVDRVVGLDGGDGVRWDALVRSQGRLGSRSLRAALPQKAGLAVLTWGPGAPVRLGAGTVREVLSAGQRGNERVVVDLPRTLDDTTAEVVTRCDRLLLVADASVAGVCSAGRMAAVLDPLHDRVGVVVRRRASALPAGQVASALDLPLVAEVPHHRRLAEHVDLGLGPVHARRSALARAARSVLADPVERATVA